jgi:hypothetical protein
MSHLRHPIEYRVGYWLAGQRLPGGVADKVTGSSGGYYSNLMPSLAKFPQQINCFISRDAAANTKDNSQN